MAGEIDEALEMLEGSGPEYTVRPHQSLGYRTPHQYLRELAHAGKT